MKNAQLEIKQRGTPDLPFARYHFRFANPRLISHTHWHPEQEILHVISGALEVMVGKTTHALSAGDICFVPPNALHCVSTLVPETEYYAFVYSYDLLTLPDFHFFQSAITEPLRTGKLILPSVLHLNDAQYPAVQAAVSQLCTVHESDASYKLTVFCELISLYAATADSLSPASDAENPVDNRAVKTCLEYMNTHYAEKLTLEELSSLVHLHPNYLCSLFRDYTGQTAFQQLMRIRTENAAKLLKEGNCTVAQAANQCGFDSVSFFSRKFKQVMGDTPKAYSKRHEKNF